MMKSALMLGLVLSLFAIPSAFAAESKCVGYSGPGGGAYSGPGGPCSAAPGAKNPDKWNRPNPNCKKQ